MTQINEKKVAVREGWGMLALIVPLFGIGVLLFFAGFAIMPLGIILVIAGSLMAGGAFVAMCGFFTLQPNEAIALSFFGPYVGTVREAGFYWANPFYSKTRVSLRARNFEGTRLKVNDKQGNPIEIAAVIVWQVTDTAQALFEVENYEEYVKVQSETAVRHLANHYAYDHGEEHEVTLRSDVEVVCEALCKELKERLSKAGVGVIEARLTHLAYAPEIAGAMLKRQQAEAVIAARQKIVHGAVSMVQMALHELTDKNIIQFDDNRKAAMVSNLLVVLCGESDVQPVIQAGSKDH